MGEFYPLSDQQHSDLLGEVPQSMESPMMRAWLGEQAKQQGLDPYDGVSRTHDHVDELGVKMDLGHHVMTNMLQSNISIAMLLPPQQVSPSLSSFSWSVEVATPAVAPHVPEEAPFYEITYKTERRYAKIERRGVAIRMTGNIMMTPEGLARLRAQLVVLAATMLLTIEYLTMRALVTCHDGPMFKRKMTLDRFSSREVEERISYDAARFASWNRNPDVEAANDMAAVGKLLEGFVKGPYAVLYPAGRQAVLGGQVMDTGLSLTVKAMNTQKQVLQFESLPSNMRMADGSIAFAVPDYSFGGVQTKEQPLLRSVLIGEHYSFSGLECNDSAWRTGTPQPGGGFATCQRDRWLYNVETDKWAKVEFMEAFRHSLFVPQNPNDEDPVDYFVGSQSPLTADSFRRGYRTAPSRTYFDNGPKKVRIFGQFNDEIIPAKNHRMVGATIADCVRAVVGQKISSDLNDGIALIRTLEKATWNPNIIGVLEQVLGDSRIDTYENLAPDTAARYNNYNAAAYAQGTDGTIQASAVTLAALGDAINTYGTPPFLLSLGGIRLLARMSESGGVTDRARELATRAANLIDTSERIYKVLQDKFPEAIAVLAAYRPVNYLPEDGFATFFSSAFLDNGNPPILYMGGDDGDVPIMTPFNWTTATLQQPQRGQWAVGTADDPFVVAADVQQVQARIGSSVHRDAHQRTPWAAQHFPMADARREEEGFRRQQQGGQGAQGGQRSAGASRSSMGTVGDDIFGIGPTFRRRGSTPMGAAVAEARRGSSSLIGAPLRNQPGIVDPDSGQLRGLKSGYEDIDVANPMRTSNSQASWIRASDISDELVRICTLVYLTAPCTMMPQFIRMMESDILVPFDLLLVRPVLEHDMYSLVVMKPGDDTGQNIMAGALLDYGVDVDHQTRKITFSLRHIAIVKVADNVAILPSRMARRYVAGGGVTLYESPSQYKNQVGRPDLIAMVVPMGHEVHRYEPIGGINVDGVNGEAAGSYRFPDAGMYERIWRLSEQAMYTRERADGYDNAAAELPDYSWTGASLNYNKTEWQPAQGHRRGGSHPGCRDVWDANEPVFPDPPTNYGEA